MNLFLNTVCRYFKLVYIAAGILMSNPEICETLDEIKISANVKVQRQKKPANKCLESSNTKVSKTASTITQLCKLHKYNLQYLIDGIKESLATTFGHFNLAIAFNLSLDYLSRVICNQLLINSDCDLIYK